MLYRQDLDQELFLMKPDLVFLDGSEIIAIADTKWKLLDNNDKKLGISQADLYQLAGYATRYKVDRLALVYPAQQKLIDPVKLKINGTGTDITILPIDITAYDKTADVLFFCH